MKWTGAIIGTIIYLLGLVIAQTHLLRYGISEISPLQIQYVLIGSLMVSTLIPAVLIILTAELLISRVFALKERLMLLTMLLLLVVIAVGLFIRYDPLRLILNMRSYGYPRWYLLNNLIVGNLQLLLIWALLLGLKYFGTSKFILRGALYVLTAVFLLSYATFYGRTVYPALDQGAWGAAPQFAEIVYGGNRISCLLLHRSSSGIYYLNLKQIPDDLEKSNSLHQYTVIPDNPVRQAVLENQVNFLPLSKLEQLKIYGLNQRELYLRYLQ